MNDVKFKSNEYYYPLGTSTCGKVKNLVTGNVLKQPIGSHGYPIVSGRIGNSRRCICVHRMVSEIWIPNPDNLPFVNHKDCDKTNNNVSNLEWCTPSQNSQHAADNGRLVFNGVCGEESNLALHTDEKIHEVCKDIETGMRNVDVSRKHDIPASYIKMLKAHKSRTDITKQYNFPKFKKQSVSNATVEWICSMLVEGKTQTEILTMSTNDKITKNLIKNIRRKSCYKTISDNYF